MRCEMCDKTVKACGDKTVKACGDKTDKDR